MNLTPFELSFDIAVMERGLEEDASEARELAGQGKDGFICPALFLFFR